MSLYYTLPLTESIDTQRTTYLLIVVVCYLHALVLRDLIFASRLLHSVQALRLRRSLMRQTLVGVVAVEEEQVEEEAEVVEEPKH